MSSFFTNFDLAMVYFSFWYVKISLCHPQLSKGILLTVLINKDSIEANK